MPSGESIAPGFWRLAGPILILIVAYAVALVLFYKNGVKNPQVQRFFASTSPGAVLSVIDSGGVYLRSPNEKEPERQAPVAGE